MVATSPGYSITLRVGTEVGQASTSDLVAAAAATGASVTALDVVESTPHSVIIDVSADTRDVAHADEVSDALNALTGVEVHKVSDRTFLLHLGGKLESTPKVPLRNRDDLSRAYTPGVARVCKAIAENKEDARRLTIKRNTVAVVTDGTAVLGLGDIGPEAAMPVMEGKAVLFKQFADVDAWPVALDTKDTEEIIAICKAIAPAYGGINLEDIAAPRCFEIEARLREELDIPVFHDDQHGTAIVTMAAMLNALKLAGKKIEDISVVVNGSGAAGIAITKLLMSKGLKKVILCDRKGAIYEGRDGLNPIKEEMAKISNLEKKAGSLADVVKGADVFIGVSAPGSLTQEMVRTMAKDPIIFAMANPVPEIMPDEAAAAGAKIIGTGRSDFPNQINNVLAFPGIFRGALDVRASDINDEMKIAAAEAIASVIPESELRPDYIIPDSFNPHVKDAVANAVKAAAIRTGVARK